MNFHIIKDFLHSFSLGIWCILRVIIKAILAITFFIVLLTAGGYGLYKTLNIWTYETELMEHDKPYGGGDLRISGTQAIVFKPITPEIKFKAVPAGKLPDNYKPEETEPWMKDVDEIENRSTIRILRGNLKNGIARIFEQPGQNGAWWISPDWRTIYVTTDWTNYKLPNGPDGYGQRWHTLWKSIDGGQTWHQLPWPDRIQPGQPLFLPDGQHGYLIADGMRIWKTSDGGAHWQEITLPKWTNQQLTDNPDGNGFSPMVRDVRARFSAYDLDSKGTLHISFYIRKIKLPKISPEITESTLLYSIPWDIPHTELPRKWLYPDIVLCNQSLADIKGSSDGKIHLISFIGKENPDDKPDIERRPAAYLLYRNNREVFRHQFSGDVVPGALFLGNEGQLILSGESRKPDEVMSDSVTLISTDKGKTWDKESDGFAWAWYYEKERNRIWKYEEHSLYWRKAK